MRDLTLENITKSVVDEYANRTPAERNREVFVSLIKHLHAFAKDVNLTEDEWFEGIDFLTRTGQTCDQNRQEFVLLSDVLGMSMLVDAINHAADGEGTESTVLGPFYVDGAPVLANGSSIVKKDIGARSLLVRGKVTDDAGTPLAGAMLDIWQVSECGVYDVQDCSQPEHNLRGRFRTDDDGSYAFVSEQPVPYSLPTDGPVGELLNAAGRHSMRPAHIHFIVSASGYKPVTTHVFRRGDEYLDSDVVFATKDSLIVDFTNSNDQELADNYALEVPFTSVSYNFVLIRD